MFDDIPPQEISDCLNRNQMLAVQDIEKQTVDILERFDRLIWPKKYLQLALEKMEQQKLELIKAWEKWTDTYENTVWDNQMQKEFYEVHKETMGNEIEYFRKQIWKTKCLLQERKIEGGVTEADILRAKMVSIDSILEINRAQNAKCLFHCPDKNPSAHFYRVNNKLHCFVCNQSWDSIAVIMKLRDCGFIEAVRFLLQK